MKFKFQKVCTRLLVQICLILWAGFSTAIAQEVFVGFDQELAPCNIHEAYSLVNGYTESDIEFVSAAVILDECSGLAFEGSTSPNVLVIDEHQDSASGYPAEGPLSFMKTGTLFNRVQVDLSGPPGQLVTLVCGDTNPWTPSVSSEVVLGTVPLTLELWTGKYNTNCELSTNGQTLVVDNLRVSDEGLPNPIPIDSPHSGVVFGAMLALAAVLLIKRL